MSAFGELKYPAGFTQFEYAVTDAPKGGAFAFAPSNWSFNQNVQTFNTLNTFVLQGEAPPRMEYCFDTLMTEAWDEPDALYGQLASTVTISADRNTFRFDLRPEARFHDGTPVMAADMAWSLMTLKEFGHPQLALDLVNLDEAEAVEDHVLELRFNGKQSDRAILAIAATAPVFSRASYGSAPFDETTNEAPLSSGPYRVKRASTRPVHRIRKGARLLGPRPAGHARPRSFRRPADRFLLRTAGGFRGFQEGRDPVAAGIHLEDLGNGI